MTSTTRRDFLRHSSALLAAGTLAGSLAPVTAAEDELLIIDTHQHLWDLSWQKLPWLGDAPEILKHNYTTPEYLAAVQGLNVQAIYMEVDVDPSQHLQEAEHVVKLSQSDEHPTIAAVIGGRPAAEDFGKYVAQVRRHPEIKGVRQVIHNDSTPRGYCLQAPFVAGIRKLGEAGLSFDLCMRPTELDDGCKLTELCPDTRFIVDHCGNADPKVFGKRKDSDQAPAHDPDEWRRSIERLAARPNVICKISGIVARAPEGWQPEDLAPAVNHCLDAFGPDRVIFGGDWPVCLLGSKLRAWIDGLRQIVKSRPSDQQRKLWHANAQRFYRLS